MARADRLVKHLAVGVTRKSHAPLERRRVGRDIVWHGLHGFEHHTTRRDVWIYPPGWARPFEHPARFLCHGPCGCVFARVMPSAEVGEVVCTRFAARHTVLRGFRRSGPLQTDPTLPPHMPRTHTTPPKFPHPHTPHPAVREDRSGEGMHHGFACWSSRWRTAGEDDDPRGGQPRD